MAPGILKTRIFPTIRRFASALVLPNLLQGRAIFRICINGDWGRLNVHILALPSTAIFPQTASINPGALIDSKHGSTYSGRHEKRVCRSGALPATSSWASVIRQSSRGTKNGSGLRSACGFARFPFTLICAEIVPAPPCPVSPNGLSRGRGPAHPRPRPRRGVTLTALHDATLCRNFAMLTVAPPRIKQSACECTRCPSAPVHNADSVTKCWPVPRECPREDTGPRPR